MARRRPGQAEMVFRSHGGRRPGAGRKPMGAKAGVPHAPRPGVSAAHPQHVTIRVRRGLPSLRAKPAARAVRRALEAASERNGMRIVHWSIQRDHVHAIVEAKSRVALSRGMQGLQIRIAKALNRTLRRAGRVFSDRYHAHALKTPREVRSALIYVLNNFRKHHPRGRLPNGWLDPHSTARSFDGWRGLAAVDVPARPAPRSWLLRVGWRGRGRLDPEATPGRGVESEARAPG